MQKHTKSILEELSNVSFQKDKENVVESRASHILESAIRLMQYIKENFDSETAYKLEKKFHSSIKNMDASKFSKGVARIKENKEVKQNLKTIDGEYKED
jgi:hypothetical protein|tara:strand:- start:869 stop:1165 length:297 start_codon:yes stop_codon:yes gene_type:complete